MIKIIRLLDFYSSSEMKTIVIFQISYLATYLNKIIDFYVENISIYPKRKKTHGMKVDQHYSSEIDREKKSYVHI